MSISDTPAVTGDSDTITNASQVASIIAEPMVPPIALSPRKTALLKSPMRRSAAAAIVVEVEAEPDTVAWSELPRACLKHSGSHLLQRSRSSMRRGLTRSLALKALDPLIDVEAEGLYDSCWAWADATYRKRNEEAVMELLSTGGTTIGASAVFNATWSGFHPAMRPQLWAMRMSLSAYERVRLYDIVRRRGVPRGAYNDIVKDVMRTYNASQHFREKQPLAVYQLLLAYAAFNHSIGYAQCMNFLASVMVEVFGTMREAHQLWALNYLLEHTIPFYFGPQMIGTQVDKALLAYYTQRRLPKLYDLLGKLGERDGGDAMFPFFYATSTWFPQLFTSILHIDLALRLWDAIIMRGPCVLFETMLRLFVANSDTIERADSGVETMLELGEWLSSQTSLDNLFSDKMDIGGDISSGDVEMRRAAQLTAVLNAQPNTPMYNKEVSVGVIHGMTNCGRGCLCEPDRGPKKTQNDVLMFPQ